MVVRRALLLLVFGLAVPAAAGGAALEPTPVGTYSTPMYVTSAPNDPDRLFIVEQAGEIELTTTSATSTYLDIKSLVLAGGEEGLLSVAFPADHETTGLLYVYYTGTDGDLHIDEFRAAGNSVDPATRRQVVHIPHPVNHNHDGGQLQFGPDGYLYLATGDGGGGGDPGENAQDLTSLLGKILRIDPRQAGGAPYSIPVDNPYSGTANDPAGGARDEIWSHGLRNPWRFSFDRMTGDLLIGDVGEANWEEVDYAPESQGWGRGANFGWDCREGAHVFEPAGCVGPFTDPIFEYPNDPSGPSSVTGGYVVRDPALDLFGRYLYADVYAGPIRSLVPATPAATDDRSEGITIANPSSFGEDACGRVYVVSLGGEVWRFDGSESGDCVSRTLIVQMTGTGTGRVTGPGIDCPGDCSQRFFDGRRVRLYARPADGATLNGWGDACGAVETCALTLDGDRSLTVEFTRMRAGTRLDLSATDRRIRRGKRVALEIQASPCPGRDHDLVTIVKDGTPRRSVLLGARCGGQLRVRPRRTARFAATIGADDLHESDASASVKIKVRASRGT